MYSYRSFVNITSAVFFYNGCMHNKNVLVSQFTELLHWPKYKTASLFSDGWFLKYNSLIEDTKDFQTSPAGKIETLIVKNKRGLNLGAFSLLVEHKWHPLNPFLDIISVLMHLSAIIGFLSDMHVGEFYINVSPAACFIIWNSEQALNDRTLELGPFFLFSSLK